MTTARTSTRTHPQWPGSPPEPATTTGGVMSTHAPAGDVPLGSFAQTAPSAKEVERRAKLAHEAD